MQKAGIDLRSTSNFVLDRLQGSPQQFLMLHLSHPVLSCPPSQNACKVTLRRRLTMLFHKSIQFPLIRDTSVSGTLKGRVITSGQGLQVWAVPRETAGFQLQPGGPLALFSATGCLSSLPLALRKVTRGARCTQVETPAYHSWPGTADGRSCCRAVSTVGHCLHMCPRSSLSYCWQENLWAQLTGRNNQ